MGAGITSITTALLLKEAGASVALLDAGRVASGVTGYTTAKITSLHGLVYADLIRSFGEDGARGSWATACPTWPSPRSMSWRPAKAR